MTVVSREVLPHCVNYNFQLKKEFGSQSVPSFPPKKLLSLSAIQLEERRAALERYVQLGTLRVCS